MRKGRPSITSNSAPFSHQPMLERSNDEPMQAILPASAFPMKERRDDSQQ